MADMPSQGTPMDPADHSATSVPNATEHHDGTVFTPDELEMQRSNDVRNAAETQRRNTYQGLTDRRKAK